MEAFPLRGYPQRGFKRIYEVEEVNGRIVPDIVDLIRRTGSCRRRSFIGPVAVCRGQVLHCPHNAFNNIIDISEIALHLAIVKYLDRLAFEYIFGKQE